MQIHTKRPHLISISRRCKVFPLFQLTDLSLSESLLEELYEEEWDVSEAVADLREMTDEHIRIIVQTSQKDGIENQNVKKMVEN